MVSVLTIAGLSGAPRAQTPAPAPRDTVAAYRNRVLGVFDEQTGDPIEGVRILDVSSGTWTETTRTGTVGLRSLPDGGGLVRLQKLGYEAQTLLVTISPVDTLPVTVPLRRTVASLPVVVTKAESTSTYISPALRGFEERRRHENGYFITEEELRKGDGRALHNVLQSKMPGIRLRYGSTTRGSSTAVYLMQSQRCANGGPPQLFLDGVALSAEGLSTAPRTSTRALGGGATVPAFDLSQYDLSMFAGIEWYPDNGTTPAAYKIAGARCGALLLWTREK
jgi:hypothetical protein